MTFKKDLDFIRESIHKLGDKYRTNPTSFFNESDLQSELFQLLLKRYNKEEEIKNIFVWGTRKSRTTRKVFSRRIHSELLLPEGRIDLAVLDLENVRFAVNSKGRYGYIQLQKGNHVFIEIKASRTNRSNIPSKNKWFESVLSDIKKLNNHAHRYANHCFTVCFDFNSLLDNASVSSLRRQTARNVELFYFKDDTENNYFAAKNRVKR
jgi:hypothetical protein